ncbi:MAG: M48 family metallopeptidase [Beijerinckiaceae bacterium]|nr:M48 family metallopeptidase [Beijerinckiaceae bacterium]
MAPPADTGVDPGLPPFHAVYFDGLTNQKHRVTFKPSAALEIAEDGLFLTAWAYGDIRRADGPKNILRLRNVAATNLARLEIADAAAQAQILSRCKLLDGEGAAGSAPAARIVGWSVAAAVSLVLTIWFGVPVIANQLTGLVPLAWEKRLGEAAASQVRAIFGGKNCASAEGSAALAKLAGTLRSSAVLPFPPELAVLSSPVPNAAALPGGKIYILNGLIDKAESPDELAGVLAHELGHVAHRDSLRRLIEDSGTGFLIGLLFGDVTGASVVASAGAGLIGAAYSREAEANADRFALALMQNLGRPPKALGDLLLRISGPEKDNPLAIFATHPMTEDRLAMIVAASRDPTGAPLLSSVEWRALKAICK